MSNEEQPPEDVPKEETPKPEPETPKEPEAPTPPPPKPAPPADPVGTQAIETAKSAAVLDQPVPRRSFIKWLSIGWIAFVGALTGGLTMLGRFFFPNVLFEPKQSFRAGYPGDYQTGEVSLKWKEKFAVWIVKEHDKMYALSTVCTHLGCTPNWLSNEAKFKCPCHGSGFYKTGINFEGPAPRPLERFKISIGDDGQILVDKTKKFQQEKGEWDDPESYILI